MSSRRSLRATSKPNPSSQQQQSNSSTSSISPGCADPSTRSTHINNSPPISVTRQSLSSEEVEGSVKPHSRRTRSQEDAKGEVVEPPDEDYDEEGEEEVTRCICGNLEYPGMPVLPGTSKGSNRNNGVGDSNAPQEDTGGLFIQCDICKVWQHGGCVGIMDEAMSPEEYFCEQCRKDLHKITTSTIGQKYSRYLPVQELTSSKGSPVAPAQDTKKSKDSRKARANAEALAGKRRSTMNSRDSAYDEAEQLRRAIEESKKEAGAPGAEGSTRRGKRSHSVSEQGKEDNTKRQRTSGPSSSPSDSKTFAPNAHSEDEEEKAPKPEGANKIRGAAARNHRAKEFREREAAQQREQERADAAGRRKARSERRRGEDSDPSEEPLSRTASNKDPPQPSPALPKPSHKKTGRPPARRGRIGRNQYTKDRDPPPIADPATSPAPSNSNGADDAPPQVNGTSSHHSPNTKNGNTKDAEKPRLKHLNPNRTTMNDMKRRVAAILEFISHTQVEMAAHSESTNTQSSNPTPPDSGASSNGKEADGNGGAMLQKLLEGQRVLDEEGGEGFANLSSVEMMEVLTRRLMRWQGEYGKWGEK